MWIEDKDKVYILDQNNNAFQILHMSFPRTSDGEQSLTNTLLDGVSCLRFEYFFEFCYIFFQEFVIDHFDNEEVYRYLVYDIIMINVNEKLYIISIELFVFNI